MEALSDIIILLKQLIAFLIFDLAMAFGKRLLNSSIFSTNNSKDSPSMLFSMDFFFQNTSAAVYKCELDSIPLDPSQLPSSSTDNFAKELILSLNSQKRSLSTH